MKTKFLMACILTILCMAIVMGASFAAPKDIDVTVNQSFNISLPSNPSTGYSWSADYDDTYLELVNQSYQSSVTGGFIVGAGGNETFLFKAIKVGETTIDFIYGGRGDIINTTSYSVTIAGVIPANNTNNNTNVTPSNNGTNTVPMQDTGVPFVGLALGILAVAGGFAATRKK